VAETPREGRGRDRGHGGRNRSESRTRRESAERHGPRGRSIERRERSYDPRSNSLATNRERSRSAFRDKNTGNLLPERLYSLSKLLVKICRHTATEEFGIAPSNLGWLPAAQTLLNINQVTAKGKGKGGRGSRKGGGGNAPTSGTPYTMDDVTEIVRRAKRSHLGILYNQAGRVTHIRAWNYHAGLRRARQIVDYDFESVPVNPAYHDRVPRVALVPGTYQDYLTVGPAELHLTSCRFNKLQLV
jgi:hypothetical protein